MSSGGKRQGAGRPKLVGSRHTYTVPDYVHEYVHKNGDGKCIKNLVDEKLKDNEI